MEPTDKALQRALEAYQNDRGDHEESMRTALSYAYHTDHRPGRTMEFAVAICLVLTWLTVLLNVTLLIQVG